MTHGEDDEGRSGGSNATDDILAADLAPETAAWNEPPTSAEKGVWMSVHTHLGKVFISHSSVDKPFVRRLARSLRRAGFETWLDEHELLPGDQLAARLAAALQTARVVLVIVSEASVRSKWLRYELNIATDRMVQGACRVIPVVIDDAELPAEVLGLLYADFQRSPRRGLESIRTALLYEERRAALEASFWRRADAAVAQAFGGCAYVLLDDEYRDRNYETVDVPVPSIEDSESTSIVYDRVSAYTHPPQPLAEQWWNDFTSAMNELPEDLYFVATERPIDFAVDRPNRDFPRVACRPTDLRLAGFGPFQYAVLVELGELGDAEWPANLEAARQLLIELAGRPGSFASDG